jgi:hypothetical protein
MQRPHIDGGAYFKDFYMAEPTYQSSPAYDGKHMTRELNQSRFGKDFAF